MDRKFHDGTPAHANSADQVEELEQLCLQIFARWCEQRKVLPLIYLLYAWPINMRDRLARTRLHATLCELLRFHPDALTWDDQLAIQQFITMHALAVARHS
ncbi:hypothetical protein VOM14_13375 [Paraburkholderia sp. MPAMCS5]|uniref:hypothetical protein n=1 Tax=Paraburkholderia sp. MPAMCS5 TaxID=3112563 RepID=UPI002E18EE8D|nr:hypothetical protein [Paraburkholderia sp. MPAMCS5]